jgi:hypothetical protein
MLAQPRGCSVTAHTSGAALNRKRPAMNARASTLS